MKTFFYINFILSLFLIVAFYLLQNDFAQKLLYLLIIMSIIGMFLAIKTKVKMYNLFILGHLFLIAISIFNLFFFKSLIVR